MCRPTYCVEQMAKKERFTQAETPKLISDPKAIAAKEVVNGLIQFDAALAEITTGIERSGKYRLRPSLILALHRMAVEGIETFAGTWRPGAVKISKSNHVPPDASIVPEMIEEMCDHVNDNWETISAIELSAYVLWKLCWIHPFTDGNGRTARVVYIVLCIALGTHLPGINTIPAQIAANKSPYYDALEHADEAYKVDENINLAVMNELLESLLAKQLVIIHQKAKNST